MNKKGNAKVHNDLEGFDIKINPFGELQSNINVDKINDFLDQNLTESPQKEEKDKE